MPVSRATCPAGISSFFEICNMDSNGAAIEDPERIGARGGGFAIRRGVDARVSVKKSSKTRISIRINSKPAPWAHTTRWAVERLVQKSRTQLDVGVDVRVEVPIGAGYGTSAAGTAATCLALADAANINVTFNEVGKITHAAEVVNKTGLGTAAALFVGGFVLVTEPGAPGIGSVDRLLFPEDHVIVCAYFRPMPTRDVLSKENLRDKVNPPAKVAMQQIREHPNLAMFLEASRKFSEEIGLQTPRVTTLLNALIAAGAVGSAQNMIGEAVHAVAQRKKAPSVMRAVRTKFPSAKVFVSDLDDRGVRLS